MIPFVKATASHGAGWIREAATAINRLIGDGAATAARASAIEADMAEIAMRVTAAEVDIAALRVPAAIAFTPSAAPASPAEGTAYYDAATHKLTVWDGSAWQPCW